MVGSFLGRRFAVTVATAVASLSIPAVVMAATAVTPATGGSAISGNTFTSGTFTPLTGPTLSGINDTDMTVAPTFGTLILNAPAGFQFDTGGTAPTLLVTCTSNCGGTNENVNNLPSGSTIAVTVSASQLTVNITDDVDGTAINTLTWQNVRVRPTAVAVTSGNLVISGATGFVGLTGTTNFGTLSEVAASNTVTAATGGSSISSNTIGGTFTSLTGPVISEGVTSSILEGTVILNAPAGFEFDTTGAAPTVLITRIAGSNTGTQGSTLCNINNVTTGTSQAVTSRTSSQITFTVDDESRNGESTDGVCTGVRNSLTFQNVRVRPTGTLVSLPSSANITFSGTAPVASVTGSTNLGTLTEVKATTTTTVVSSGTSTYGDTVTLTATVTNGYAPTGTVQFKDNGTDIGSAVALNGSFQAVLMYSGLTAGSHTITAVYAGDGINAGSTSAGLPQTVNKKTLTVTADAATRNYGDANPVFSATFTGFANSETLNTSDVTGTVSLTTTATASDNVGSYPLTAALGSLASNNYTFSFAASTLTINPVALSVTTNAASRAYGVANPTFTVSYATFVNGDDANDLGGTLVFTTVADINSPVGSYTVTPSGLTSTNYTLSFFAGNLSINQAVTGTSTVLDTPTPNSLVGTNVELHATVSGGLSPTGTIRISSGSTVLGTVSVSNGSGSIFKTFTIAGTYSLKAEYLGDTNHLSSTGTLIFHVVDKDYADTTTTVSATNPSIVGDEVEFTATVDGAYNPTGDVKFYDGSGATLLGTSTLSSGSATFKHTFTTAGFHPINAHYLGDANNHASSGSLLIEVTVQQEVQKDTPDYVFTLNAPSTSIVGTGGILLTATVSGAYMPTGTVEFYNGTTLMGTGSLDGNFEATYTAVFTSVGTYTLHAHYLGDPNNNPSTANATVEVTTTQTVNQASPLTTTVLAVSSPSVVGDMVTLSAHTDGGYLPSGDMVFKDFGVPLATVPLSATGAASYSLDTLAVGSHDLSAEYLGDTNNLGSLSPTVTVHIVQKKTSIVALASIQNPHSSFYGIVFNTTVTGYHPTGSVSFYEGTTLLSTVALDASGFAQLGWKFPVGTYHFTMNYSGDFNNFPSSTDISVQVVDMGNENDPGDGGSNGSGRGAGVQGALTMASYLAKGHFGTTPPPAFGGGDTIPMNDDELQYFCSMQRALPRGASDEFLTAVAQLVSSITGRTQEYVLSTLTDDNLCAEINASLSPANLLTQLKLTPFAVNARGVPVSSNPTWNKCISGGRVTLEDIKSNPDRTERRRAGVSLPETCASYHTQSVWRHPDLDIYFVFDKATRQLIVPEGYFVTPEKNVAAAK